MLVFKKSKLDFGIVEIGKNKVLRNTFTNDSFNAIEIQNITFITAYFTAIFTSGKIAGKFVPNATIFFGLKGELLDENFNYYITDQSNGVAGYTDSVGNLFLDLAESSNTRRLIDDDDNDLTDDEGNYLTYDSNYLKSDEDEFLTDDDNNYLTSQ